jgi:hypothetical protein
MSREAFASFEDFYSAHKRDPRAIQTLSRLAGYAAFKGAGIADRRLRRHGVALGLGDRIPERFHMPPLRQAMLFPWAVSVVRQEYAEAIEAAGVRCPPAGRDG